MSAATLRRVLNLYIDLLDLDERLAAVESRLRSWGGAR